MDKIYNCTWQLTADECNPFMELPVPTLIKRAIEVATLHANTLGVGYADLIGDNCGWVLSRLSVEMLRYPRVLEHYTFTTWIESHTPRLSFRNMEISGEDGTVIGWVRTVWAVMDFTTRHAAGAAVEALRRLPDMAVQRDCRAEALPRRRMGDQPRVAEHTFHYADCDLNRHVNTIRYVELLLNQFGMDKHEAEMVGRLEITFHREIRYGETVTVAVDESQSDDCLLAITGDGSVRCTARIGFAPRTVLP